MRILWILRFRGIQEFLLILKILTNFKNKIRYREKLQIGLRSMMQTYYYNWLEKETAL